MEMSKRNYNKAQKSYLLAKAQMEVLEDQEKELEQKYIINKGIINPDGTIPKATWCIDDEEIADKAINEFGKILSDSGLWAKILEGRKELKAAENNLIKYGLSIAPPYEKEILTKAAETNYTIRQKILNLVMRLDTTTVK